MQGRQVRYGAVETFMCLQYPFLCCIDTVVSRKYGRPPPFSRQVVAKGHLLLESTPTLLAQQGST